MNVGHGKGPSGRGPAVQRPEARELGRMGYRRPEALCLLTAWDSSCSGWVWGAGPWSPLPLQEPGPWPFSLGDKWTSSQKHLELGVGSLDPVRLGSRVESGWSRAALGLAGRRGEERQEVWGLEQEDLLCVLGEGREARRGRGSDLVGRRKVSCPCVCGRDGGSGEAGGEASWFPPFSLCRSLTPLGRVRCRPVSDTLVGAHVRL